MTTGVRRRRTDRWVEPRARSRHRLVERQSTTDLAQDRAERLLLAEILMEPGQRVAVLNADNQVDRWTTLEEAVACDEPFFIRAREDVLILDADHHDQHPALNELTNLLRSWHCTPVVVASGQRHHRQLFCWIPSRPHLEHVRQRARQAGIDTRPSRDIRPPLAPHRLGRVPRLLAPATVDACVAALCSAPDTWPDIDGPDQTPSRGVRSGHDEPTAPGALSARMQRLLRDGDTEGRYASGSEVVQALVTSMRSNDWSFDEIEQVLSDPAHSGGMSLQERQAYKSQRVADAWLRRCVERADDLLIASADPGPAPCCSPETDRAVDVCWTHRRNRSQGVRVPAEGGRRHCGPHGQHVPTPARGEGGHRRPNRCTSAQATGSPGTVGGDRESTRSTSGSDLSPSHPPERC